MGYNSLVPLPSSLVSPLRSALSSQGFPAASVTDSGEIDPAALLSGAFSKVTVRTRLMPPISLDPVQTVTGPTGFWTKLAQPAITVEGRFGKSTYAPAGDPGENQGWLWMTAIVLGLVGFGYWLGRR